MGAVQPPHTHTHCSFDPKQPFESGFSISKRRWLFIYIFTGVMSSLVLRVILQEQLFSQGVKASGEVGAQSRKLGSPSLGEKTTVGEAHSGVFLQREFHLELRNPHRHQTHERGL